MGLSPQERLERKAYKYFFQLVSCALMAAGLWAVSYFTGRLPETANLKKTALSEAADTSSRPAPQEYRQVSRVIDGDTFELDNKHKVRLIGIDTPESRINPKARRDSERTSQDVPVIVSQGQQSKEFVKNLLEGRRVRLEYDAGLTDRYGRILAYAYLEDGTFINAEIIQEGYASVLTIPPNVKYVELFKKLYDDARSHNRGLWKIVNTY